MTANLVRLCSHPVWLDLSINGPPMRSSYCQHIIHHILQQATQSRTQREGTIINTPTTWTIFVDTQDAERQVGYGGLSPVYERRLHLRKSKREDVTSIPTETLSLRSLPAIRTNSLKEHIVCGLCPRAPTTAACSKCSTRVCQRCIVARTMLCRVCWEYEEIHSTEVGSSSNSVRPYKRRPLCGYPHQYGDHPIPLQQPLGLSKCDAEAFLRQVLSDDLMKEVCLHSDDSWPSATVGPSGIVSGTLEAQCLPDSIEGTASSDAVSSPSKQRTIHLSYNTVITKTGNTTHFCMNVPLADQGTEERATAKAELSSKIIILTKEHIVCGMQDCYRSPTVIQCKRCMIRVCSECVSDYNPHYCWPCEFELNMQPADMLLAGVLAPTCSMNSRDQFSQFVLCARPTTIENTKQEFLRTILAGHHNMRMKAIYDRLCRQLLSTSSILSVTIRGADILFRAHRKLAMRTIRARCKLCTRRVPLSLLTKCDVCVRYTCVNRCLRRGRNGRGACHECADLAQAICLVTDEVAGLKREVKRIQKEINDYCTRLRTKITRTQTTTVRPGDEPTRAEAIPCAPDTPLPTCNGCRWRRPSDHWQHSRIIGQCKFPDHSPTTFGSDSHNYRPLRCPKGSTGMPSLGEHGEAGLQPSSQQTTREPAEPNNIEAESPSAVVTQRSYGKDTIMFDNDPPRGDPGEATPSDVETPGFSSEQEYYPAIPTTFADAETWGAAPLWSDTPIDSFLQRDNTDGWGPFLGDMDEADKTRPYHAEASPRYGYGLMIDTGSVGNLSSQAFAVNVGAEAMQNGRSPRYTSRERPIAVSGIGYSSEFATRDSDIPVCMRSTTGEYFSATVTLPSIPDSHMPGLLGLRAMTGGRCLLDCVRKQLFFLGPGHYDLTRGVPAGTKVFDLETSPSGHLSLPITHYRGFDQQTYRRFQQEHYPLSTSSGYTGLPAMTESSDSQGGQPPLSSESEDHYGA